MSSVLRHSAIACLRHIRHTWTDPRIRSKPHTFYAVYASSAPVKAIVDFWHYYEPIREHMPRNCSNDIQAVIARVDRVLSGSNAAAIKELRELFGLVDLEHSDDFANARKFLDLGLGLGGFSMDLIASYDQPEAMAGLRAVYRPKWRILPVLRCFGGEGWTAR